ncbi:recombination mediator RecR [Porphyromonas circumdentaria]|uniref:recombination mediator RecR n=1 Tax=Porphyromonas circumdentaria TaxID=29524 RepID=UPI0026DC2EDC|nr:recombination mediator RecR [Porphyromonas circumdentaria]MDO4721736.1 recombination mediator RecR [Porphyromonas circumdentaria]
MESKYSSKWLEKAVDQLSLLPGIGRKTALRLALYILRKPDSFAHLLGTSIKELKDNIIYCRRCHNISDTELCPICSSPQRDSSVVCVVESIRDVMAIERTAQYKGLYHVLGGIISPIDGISPNDLEIDSLVERIPGENIQEVILAISPTMEGDTTNFYIYRRLSPFNIKISLLSRGVAMGDELEYTDDVTLARAIRDRSDFSQSFQS